MGRRSGVLTVLALTAGVALGVASMTVPANARDAGPAPAASAKAGPGVAGPASGLVRPHGARSGGGGKPTPNMTFHGGVIMPTAAIKAVFWGTTWGTYSGDKITGIDSFYTGFSGSNYARTSDEYRDSSGGVVGPTSTYQGHLIDTSAAAGGANTSVILAEVNKLVSSGAIVPDPSGNSYVPVYTDVPRGSAGYCAWHAAGTSPTGVRIEFAFFFKLDGDAGCNPADTTTGHSEGLAAIANVSAHELSEARTDPASPGAWYDSKGAENGDKCAWTFGAPSVTFSNGSAWKLQGEWSNAAYTAGTGYPNSSGQHGCLGGS
ncbi:MAG: hypothetical protein JWR52_879 [Marmoricola sp.]|nr:hypothetical protein [Marmoricola sp.]